MIHWNSLRRFGRASNLPTIWTNALCGVVLAGAAPHVRTVLLLLLALSAIYLACMAMHDATGDPIPRGHVHAVGLWMTGGGLLVFGLVLLMAHAWWGGHGWRAVAGGAALAVLIMLHNVWHKGHPFGPMVMGLGRVMVYFTAAWTTADQLSQEVLGGASALLSYVVGLSIMDRLESFGRVRVLWPLAFLVQPVAYLWFAWNGHGETWMLNVAMTAWIGWTVQRLFGSAEENRTSAAGDLFAGIALLDTALMANHGEPWAVCLGLMGFLMTRWWQRTDPVT